MSAAKRAAAPAWSAEQLAAIRHMVGLSQVEFGKEVGASRASVGGWEEGRFAIQARYVLAVTTLMSRHTYYSAQVETSLRRGDGVPRRHADVPHGWHTAAIARAMSTIERMP